jgi:cytochrome c biogenesis protein CcmG, thiol:disulfide interchange protein DsbE
VGLLEVRVKRFLVTMGVVLLSGGLANPSRVMLDSVPPEFTLVASDGRVVRLEELRGKPVVLNFWASWCGPCKREFPDLNSIFLRNKNSFEFLAVAISEPRDTSLNFIRTQNYAFTVLTDPVDGSSATEQTRLVAGRYGIEGIPTTYFIDVKGRVRHTSVGGLGPREFKDYLKVIGVNDAAK